MESENRVILCTDENLEAIVIGLDIGPNDNVLSVGGSGDQPFALLEKANTVRVVDNNPDQITCIRKRVRLLQEGEYLAFLNSDRSPYFEREQERNIYLLGIVGAIRAKLNRLIIGEPADIFDVAQQEQGFNKIYLSNAIQWSYGTGTREYIESLKRIAINLPSNGLIYIAADFGVEDIVVHNTQRSLCIDPRLTNLARGLEGNFFIWTPCVYRVIDK